MVTWLVKKFYINSCLRQLPLLYFVSQTIGFPVFRGAFLFYTPNIMAYSDKLQNPLWQKKRLKIFERDKFTCQANKCGDTTSQLEVHHYDYIPGIQPWEYPDDMLITLCHKCHDKENGRLQLEKDLATTLKMKGFLLCDLLALSSKLDTDSVFTETLLKILRNG